MLQPRLELRRRLSDHPESHVRMLHATELRALPAKTAGVVCLDPLRGDARWNQVALAVQIRNPEAVDYVVRRSTNHYRPAHRDVDLIGSSQDPAGILIQV